ncbi:unnamed protein product [Heterobilharzia americana]|nr:unnamed protein product [Heterobilharzia americana]
MSDSIIAVFHTNPYTAHFSNLMNFHFVLFCSMHLFIMYAFDWLNYLEYALCINSYCLIQFGEISDAIINTTQNSGKKNNLIDRLSNILAFVLYLNINLFIVYTSIHTI